MRPTVYRGTINIDKPRDTFVHLPGYQGAV